MSKPPVDVTRHDKRVRKKRAQKKGRWAELLIRLYLRACGYRILASNYKTPVGEIDLIARRGNTVAFIEVKARDTFLHAAEAITPRQQERIIRASNLFLSQTYLPHCTHCDFRYDVALVRGRFSFQMVRGAWLAS